jgi:hypothetical protein
MLQKHIRPPKGFLPLNRHFSPYRESIHAVGQASSGTFHVIAVHVEFGFEAHQRRVSVPMFGRLLEPIGS